MMSADSAWPKCAVLFFTFHLTPGAMHVQNYVKDGLSSLHPASPIKLTIQGDGNLFAQRNFKKDAHSDFRSCILIDLLERFLGRINLNLNRSALNRITYNVVSSTQASEYIKAQNNTGADCDCMLCT